jgi:hypothetical protein
MAESDNWLESLNGELPEVQIEKHNSEIVKVCQRARTLLQRVKDVESPVYEVLNVVREMQVLDQAASNWRQGTNWAFRVVSRADISATSAAVSTFPENIHLNKDVWIAYEWNYHRTARILMHEQLLRCLERIRPYSQGQISSEIDFMTHTSIEIIRKLADDILSTVPQMLGDIDRDGRLQSLNESSRCRALGGYFLLWPIKIVKQLKSATEEQRHGGRIVFERVREYTGMKSALGDASII